MLIKKVFLIFLLLFYPVLLLSVNYIDVVIPCHKKDIFILERVIKGAKTYIKDIRKIIIISEENYTNSAIYFDESKFPFNKQSIRNIFEKQSGRSLNKKEIENIGWYYQQLLKLYSLFVIPEISENVLILDADTVFMRHVRFIGDQQEVYYNISYLEHHQPYFDHIHRLLPGLKIYNNSGIVHHMLFQKKIIEQLFETIEKVHRKPFWEVFCEKIEPKFYSGSGASEYELYFNFVFSISSKAKIRPLKWKNSSKIDPADFRNFDYISYHSYMLK